MKTMPEPVVISPSLVILAIVAAAVVFLVMRGTTIPLLSNVKISLVILLVLGMAMCTTGIGRVAASGQWLHPLSIVGYLLGAAILVLSALVFFNVQLPFLTEPQHAVLMVGILIAAKLVNSIAHYFLSGKNL